MALSMSLMTASGAPAVYWRLVRWTVDLLTQAVTVTVFGYYTEDDRRAGRSPQAIREFEFTAQELGIANPDMIARSRIYAAIKALAAEFSGAADVPSQGEAD